VAGTDWLRQHQATAGTPVSTAGATEATGRARPVGAAAWLTTHVPVEPHLEFSPPKTSIRISCTVLLCLVVLCAVFLDASVPLLVVIIWAITFAFYRSSPQRRERTRSHKVFSERRSDAARASRAVSALERAELKVVREAEGQHSAAERKAERARADEQREIAGINDRLDREIQRLNVKVSVLQGQEDADVAAALHALQRAHIDERLRATPVKTSGIRGIGRATAETLAAYGIFTAADIAAVHGAAIMRRDGVSVSPRGIGQGRAAALYSWRLQVEARAQSTQPTALPLSQRQGIAYRYAQQRQSLKGDQVTARRRAALELTDLHNKWAVMHSGFANEVQQAKERLETLRTAPNLEIVAARKQSETANWQRDFAKLELNRYSRIRYSRYLKRLVIG
jgi:predicted flap endonuclease-1-like 5' DNA nuclease